MKYQTVPALSIALALGVTFAPLERWIQNADAVWWFRLAAWVLVALVIFYTPGRLIQEFEDRQINRDRAYRIICKLHDEGQLLRNTTNDQRLHEWDLRAQEALRRFCSDDRIRGYRQLSGREANDPNAVLSRSRLDAALCFLWEELRTDIPSARG